MSISPAPLAAELLLAVTVPMDEDVEIYQHMIELIPDGVSRMALGQMTWVVRQSLHRLAEIEGRPAREVLLDLWPALHQVAR